MHEKLERNLRTLDWIAGLMSRASVWFAWICLWAMVFIILIDITGRRFFGHSTQMADELSGYFLVVITFLGAAYTLRQGRHISVDLLQEHLSPKANRILSIFTSVFALAFIVIMILYSLKLSLSSLKFGSLSGTMLNIPMWIPQIVVPVGLFILALAALSHILRLIFLPDQQENAGPSSAH
jgi:TRAP-type C4-dicarboxylate transport system permease small subunit